MTRLGQIGQKAGDPIARRRPRATRTRPPPRPPRVGARGGSAGAGGRARSRRPARRRSSSWRSRFSAKLSRAPRNQRGPRTGSGGAMRSSPTTTSSHGARSVPLVGHHPAEPPDLGPERVGTGHRPVVQAGVVLDALGARRPPGLHEPEEARSGSPARPARGMGSRSVRLSRSGRACGGGGLVARSREGHARHARQRPSPSGEPAGAIELGGAAGHEVGGLNCACCASSHDLW